MESFHRAKIVRLKSHNNKFLTANADEKTVKQHTNGSSPAAKWTVELVDGKPNLIRLKSQKTSNYLSSSDDPFLLGVTGKRVYQVTSGLKSDSRVHWEPIKDGPFVKLRSPRSSTFLRANAGSVPPYRNSVTHDIPSRQVSQTTVLWIVDVLEMDHAAEEAPPPPAKVVVPAKEPSRSSTASADSGRSGLRPVAVPVEEPRRTSTDSLNSGVSDALSFVSVRTPSPERQEEDVLSISSPTSSNGGSPIRLYSATPVTLKTPPYIRKLENNSSTSSRVSNSSNRLNSLIADATKLIDDDGQRNPKKSEQEDQPPPGPSPEEVQDAKQTLTEVLALDFESVVSSGKLSSVESAISILIANEGRSRTRTRTGSKAKLESLKSQVEALREERGKAEEEVEACEEYVLRKAEMKAGLQKEVGRARELQRKDMLLIDKVEELRKKREELMREMERVEGEIVEKGEERVRNEGEMEELYEELGRRSEAVKVMEKEEEAWVRRREAVERWLREVEGKWDVFQISLQMFEG